jgi:hypothetical protein
MRNTHLATAIAAEKLDEFGNPVPPPHCHPTQRCKFQTVAKRKRVVVDDAGTDADDDNFFASSTEESDDADADIMEVSNEEV